jgi:hypothetical protein
LNTEILLSYETSHHIAERPRNIMTVSKTYDETKTHEITKGIYSVGFADRKAGFCDNS